MSGDVLNADENVEDENEYGFTVFFFQKYPIIIVDNIKMQFMKMHRTPKSNIDEQLLNNPINENIDERKRFTIGIEVLKLGKINSHINIKKMNKSSDDMYQIDKCN